MSDNTTKEDKEQINLQIGQIVYILSDKAEAIVPVIVVEELVHKKLDGNSVSWKVAIGPPEKKKIVSSSEISGEIYSSLEEIQVVMMKRLGGFVTDLVNKAEKRTETWYGKQIPKEASITKPDGKFDPSDLLDIIDGREKAKQFRASPGQEVTVNTDNKNAFSIPEPTFDNPRDALRNKLMHMTEEDVVDGQDIPAGGNNEFLLTEDGRKIPIKYNIKE